MLITAYSYKSYDQNIIPKQTSNELNKIIVTKLFVFVFSAIIIMFAKSLKYDFSETLSSL